MATELAHKDFYTTLSTVIPILFLAISIQSSVFIRNTTYSTHDGLYKFIHAGCVSIVLITLAGAEGVVFHVLYTGQDEYMPLYPVVLMMVIATVFIIIDFVLSIYDQRKLTGLYFFFILVFLVFAVSFAKFFLKML